MPLAKTFGELCGKFNTHVTSDVSDKRTRVDVVIDHYLPNFIKGGKKASAQRRLEQGHEEDCGEQLGTDWRVE